MSLRPPARTAKDYVLPFLIIVSLGIVIILSFQLWGLTRDDGTGGQFAQTGTASLDVTAGEVEVYLPAAEAWKLVTGSDIVMSDAEKVRTGKASTANLTFDDGTQLVLDASTEVTIVELSNTLRRRTAKVLLGRGNVWVTLGTTGRSDFVLASDIVRVNASEGSYLLARSAEKSRTALSAVSGGANVTIFDPKKNGKDAELTTLIVEAGETAEVTTKHINLLRIGGTIDLVKPTPKDITSAEFYIAQTGPSIALDTDTTDAASSDNENSTDKIDKKVTTDSNDSAELPTMPIITKPIGSQLTTSDTKVTVTGTVDSATTAKVQVSHNGGVPYTLSSFEAGDTTWRYNASVDFDNLVAGTNTYEIVALAASGAKSPAATVTLIYEPTAETPTDSPDATTEPVTQPSATTDTPSDTSSGVPEVGGEVFGLPVVTFPVEGETYTTEPLKFEGTVPAGTEFVEVNGYRLSQGFTGGTTWWYNASTEYENLAIGENEYEIEAISTDGTRKSIVLKFNYQPVE